MPDPAPAGPAPSIDRLQELAKAYGVGVDFWGFYRDLHLVSSETLVRVLASLGVDASTEAACERALVDRADQPWRRVLPPTVIMRAGAATRVPVHVRHGEHVRVWVIDENGREWQVYQGEDSTPPREVDGLMIGQASFWLPTELPLGWHRLRAESAGRHDEATLIVVPQRVTTADELPARTGRARTWGLMTQLYSVRSTRSWGVGDIEDLADLAAIGGAAGADWVLVNPLHAAEPTAPMEASPYLPSTRRFFCPLYIRVEAIPEAIHLETAARRRVARIWGQATARNADADEVPRNAAYSQKLEALELVYAVRRSPGRAARLAAFRAEHGRGLEDFALWCALREVNAEDAPLWQETSPQGEVADALRAKLRDRIDFHIWMQWVIDEQLETAQATARRSGMGVGIVHDLAVGVHAFGADAWVLRDVLARNVHVGAPPDMYNQQGQNWSQPPWHPGRLAQLGYAPFRDMVRTILRHAGGIRIDHALGLFRLWWVPKGLPADQGAYVYYDHEALIGILCLEAQRAGAVIIGEDLGTYEPWVREYLAGRGLLGTSVLWFEYAGEAPLPPEAYRRECLASVTTHDLPPTAGYLAGEHITLRDRLGLLARDLEQEIVADREEQQQVLEMCRARGLLGSAAVDVSLEGSGPAVGSGSSAWIAPTEQETIEALYLLLAAAPSLMQGVALVDAVGERRVQNQPGTDKEYPNWKIPLADSAGVVVQLEQLATNPRAQSLFRVVREALA